ncbi:MAG: hypothetical protein JO061_04805, partial [Acidobacteriaceae bacterium]|nr:hypothetical protein [Acidobacteriaceae bacterium]
MTLRLFSIIAVGPLALLASGAAAPDNPAQQIAFVQKYCVACHSGAKPAGKLALAKLDYSHPERSAAEFEKILAKLNAGM